VNPRLVYCAITGYGQTGPLAHHAGHDINYLARAGMLGLTGPEDGTPQVPGFQVADMGGGALFAVAGILAALHARATTGEGRFVDVSMCEGSMLFGVFGLSSAMGGLPFMYGSGPLAGGIAPFSTYRTKDDRFVALGALEPKFWMAFCSGVGIAAGMDALMPGPHQAEWKARLTEVFAQKSLAEWVEWAKHVDCCLEPVLEASELPADAQHQAREMFKTLPTRDGTTLPQIRVPIAEPPESGTAPEKGEHTVAVLKDAGFDDARIAALKSAGVLG
jgi:crotonobetainyl-CoA:carnitine CoA-transferase CaiB-like acyl-CoA transferase